MNEEMNDFSFGGAFDDALSGESEIDFLRGKNIEIPVELTFEEAARGTQKKVSFKAMGACKTCSGAGGKPGAVYSTCQMCAGKGYVQFFWI
jgi:molecular chaperone DnaJ